MNEAGVTNFREGWLTSQDGLRLYYRDYDGGGISGTPVLCLPGVTRNSKDFARLAERLSQRQSGRHRVICPDFRGRGRSQYDSDWTHYIPPTYVDDVRHLLVSLGIHRVHVIGTSLGGIVAMAMAVATPGVLASVVLNDIGPEIGSSALSAIMDYMKDDTPLPDWDTAAGHVRAAYLPNLPRGTQDDWMEIARHTYRESADGKLVHDWDYAIVKQFERAMTSRFELWPLFMALGRVPVLCIRGALSSILSQQTLALMKEAMPTMADVTAEDCGHPARLSEPNVLEAIDAHLARV
ncbi:MAG: alpha/beta hydrolase [Proteobacteria bacterium]|nr:alpha/beta hydrolase [Pseudomonadota bacterium]